VLLKTTLSLAAARRPVCLAMVGLLTGFVGAVALAQPVEIGRSTLTLPDAENWKVQDASADGIQTSGDINQPMPMGTKQLTYFSADKLTKAVLISKVTKGGVAGVTMTWTNPCPGVKQSSVVYKADKGSVSDIDCLVVIKVNQFDSFVNSGPQLKKSFGDVRPNTKDGFYVQYSKSMGAGGYAFSQALVASDFKGIEADAVKTDTTISPSVLAWATAFAKSNAAAIDSLSGKWSIPALVFNSK
jgi:hypothetical protein